MNTTANTTATATMPKIGEGMTLCYPQDNYPFVIVRVSDSGKTVWVKPVKGVDKTTGHEPAYFNGPYPVWSHSYTAEELASMVIEDAPERAVRLGKRGWTSKGSPFAAGGARYRRDYSW